jgi:hypothetical protein
MRTILGLYPVRNDGQGDTCLNVTGQKSDPLLLCSLTSPNPRQTRCLIQKNLIFGHTCFHQKTSQVNLLSSKPYLESWYWYMVSALQYQPSGTEGQSEAQKTRRQMKVMLRCWKSASLRRACDTCMTSPIRTCANHLHEYAGGGWVFASYGADRKGEAELGGSCCKPFERETGRRGKVICHENPCTSMQI